MTEGEFEYPSTHLFGYLSFVLVPPLHMTVVGRGQRFGKNKKGETVFEQNSYLLLDQHDKLHYALESEIVERNIF